MYILAIETSCDETACALLGEGKLLGHKVSSQLTHSMYGGVVPEFASREHARLLLNQIESMFSSQYKFNIKNINLIAYTAGPGLAGSLLVGAHSALALSHALNVTAVAVNHLEAHLLSVFLEHDIKFPYLSLLVSGGHTQLWRCMGIGNYECICSTVDDAVGEAFDKTAVLLGLGYPGGGKLADLATRSSIVDTDDMSAVKIRKRGSSNFYSFSGLKTAMRRKIEAKADVPANLACLFEVTAVKMLLAPIIQELATTRHNYSTFCLVGGVAQNKRLQDASRHLASVNMLDFVVPSDCYCGDNAAMVAQAAWLRASLDESKVEAYTDPRMQILV